MGQLASPLWLCVGPVLGEAIVPYVASGGLPGNHPIPSHPSSCCPGVEPQSGWVCVHSSTMQAFEAESPESPAVAPMPQTHRFLQPEVMGIYLPGDGTLGCAVWPGAGITYPQVLSSNFYPPHANVGPSVPLPQLPPLCTTLHLFTSPPF